VLSLRNRATQAKMKLKPG